MVRAPQGTKVVAGIRVLIADDHALFRAGIRRILESFDGVDVVAEASDGHEALRLTERHHPHVLLLDVAMPGLNGIEATARVCRDFAQSRVILLSMHEGEEYVLRALRAGASGYLLKSASPTELELAVRAVARGETYLSPAVSRHLVDDYRRRQAPATDPLDQITLRQREILQLIAEGNTTKAIAQKLGLSVKTVENHRAGLMERLDIHDLAGLVRWAIARGLVKAES
jgi:DNA-binding NarL/FixJ family response regulator